MSFTPITETDALAQFCQAQADSRFLAIDTEFVRESTYYPQLCLIQVAGDTGAAAIDALAEGLDLAPFFDLLAKEDLPKVFHAGRQDLEIFYNLSGRVPHPVFDTQVAAMVLGFGDQVGYDVLVRKVEGVQIDKSSRFTDWSQRPLTDRQITYAMADVIHLRPVYESLSKRLEDAQRAHWLIEEMAVLTAERTYRADPSEAWRRLKARGLKPRALAVLREIAAWREAEAQRRDTVRNRVLRDDTLLDIAGSAPRDAKALGRIRGFPKGQIDGRIGTGVLQAVQRAFEIPDKDLPKSRRREAPPPGAGPIGDLLKVLLKARCEEAGVASRLVANGEEIEKLAAEDNPDSPVLHGWRRELFGEDALRLKRGELTMSVRDGAVVVDALGDRAPANTGP